MADFGYHERSFGGSRSGETVRTKLASIVQMAREDEKAKFCSRCWQYNWVLEFDIVGLFDNIDHDARGNASAYVAGKEKIG